MNKILFSSLILLCTITACTDKDTGEEVGTVTGQATGRWIISVRIPDGSEEYVLQAQDIENKTMALSDKNYNVKTMPSIHNSWMFRKDKAIGMAYQQGDPGIGYGCRIDPNNSYVDLGRFIVSSRFTNYDFLNDSTFVTSVGGQVSPDNSRNDGATFEFWRITNNRIYRASTKTIWTENLTHGSGDQVTFSSIVGLKDGTFLSAMVRSKFRERNSENGGSSIGDITYPDSCWIARLDTNLNVKHVYKSDRLSYSAGQYRAQMWREVFLTQDSIIYVFSNAMTANTTKRAGALRINHGADDFDATYYWDIQTALDDYKFRRVWYLEGDKFLLEIYNDKNVGIMTAGHKFAIIEMQSKQIHNITGLPNHFSIISGAESGGVPSYRNGYVYLPISVRGGEAQIYKVSATTYSATPITTITGAEEVRGVAYLE